MESSSRSPADQLVEDWRWHQKVKRAEAAMRLELAEDDGPQAYARLAISVCLDQQLARIYEGAGRVPGGQLRDWIVNYSPPYRTWDSEAWKAVVAFDVGCHMGPERLVEWSSPYRMMPSLTDRNSDETELATELHEALPPSGSASDEDAAKMRGMAGRLRALNRGITRGSQLLFARMRTVRAAVPERIERTLQTEARRVYGNCAQVPDLNAEPVAQSLESRRARREREKRLGDQAENSPQLE